MKIFVGFDSTQEIAFDVCAKSIRYHSNVEIVPLIKNQLEKKKIYNETKQGSTEFSFTRFLVPFLSNFKDYAIFCDSDFIWNCDPLELEQFLNKDKSVFVVKHDLKECVMPKIKMHGIEQFWYPKKNWSSLMIFNSSHLDCIKLTPEIVSSNSGKYLHEFNWTTEDYIGDLPKTYNYLVGYYNDINNPKAVHFTSGGPWHPGYETVDFSNQWYFYKNV